ncbi:MAG: glycosyltransferase family 1 protein [Candidatus Moranbacteria bacterium]|nr:glycosyltransferase family 1 protein [Candidatus Moranbacteria bacterium]
MARIGIDVRCLAEGRRTGVEEYTRNLLQNIFTLDTRDEFVLFFNSFRSAKADFAWLEKYPNVSLRKFNYPNKLLNFLFWYLNWPKIDQLIGGADIFFMPNIIFGSVSQKTKLISTIHDLSFERYPETFSWKRRFWHMFINSKKICQQSDKIIAVSNSTKNDIVNLYKINPDKISVSYNGISEKFQIVDRNNENLIRVKEKYKLPYKFILYLGTIEPRKNISAIIQAYAQLQKDAAEAGQAEMAKYKLVVAGSQGWLSDDIFAEIEQSDCKDDIVVVKFVEEDDKEFVLNLASLFVYPSKFEGFGFPPLEAMACGVPVITSNNSSLPEIAGLGSIMIDPDKPDEIFLAMKEILNNRELRNSLIDKGLIQSKKFSWTKPAEDFLKLVNKI